jgi:8-amino-7-oxononanoate synthase
VSPAVAHPPVSPTAPPPAPAASTLTDALREELDALAHAGLRRTLRPAARGAGHTRVPDGGPPLVDFASNDYLGLAADPRPAAAAAAVLAREGLGAGAARLLGGDHPLHHALEAALAALKQAPRALLFPSGYAANTGALPALAGAGDVVYSDALNHASIVDGCRLARANGATVRVVPHADADALARLLSADAGRFRRRWLVVEGVYSMDGDRYPLDALVRLARAHGAYTYVDDAHATGVLGATGAGSAEHWGVAGAVDVTVGTLGKALGSAGAFAAGSDAACELLLQRARPFVFTTASPPALAAGALAALEAARAEPWRRARVLAHARRLRAALAAAGRPAPGPADAHVVPVPVGDPRAAVAAGEALRARGFLVGAVRPPTVPAGASRLRLSVSAAHTEAQVAALAAAVAEVLGAPA